MTVDLEAIARRGRCDVTSLRAALPLIEQGYTPPFLARYRRDELSGVDEASLWGLAHALQAERSTSERRDELHQAWEQTSLADPALGHAIRKGNSKRTLDRLARRLKAELAEQPTPSAKLAVRVMNPQRGDADDLLALAESIEGIDDTDAAVAGLDNAIARRLAGDPRIMGAAVRWLAKNARIHIATISDPHTSGGDDDDSADDHGAHSEDDSHSDPASEDAAEEINQEKSSGELAAVTETVAVVSAAADGEASARPGTAEIVTTDASADVSPATEVAAADQSVTPSDSTAVSETTPASVDASVSAE